MRVAKFEKVSFEQFKNDYQSIFDEADENFIRYIYDNIKLPKRATSGSAGYDFFAPFHIVIPKGETQLIPTGIRCYIENEYVLSVYPRSGLGFKYRIQLDNTVGIIDADYYNALNEGHIMIKLTNDSYTGKTADIESGKGFAQGIFTQYFLTYDDEVSDVRTGGFGSTTK